ncbi:MAG: hypothetical protein ACETVM_01435 [Candidatus Bathyarchaeia archaeon]
MKALHAVLICLIILVVFNYTAATLGPLIQQDNNLILKEKTALHNSLKVSKNGKPGLISLGDPIDNPKPH